MSELKYERTPAREETRPDGSTVHCPAQSPEWHFGFWRQQYKGRRGERRKEAVREFADSFQVDEPLAERMLRGDVPHRIDADGTLVFTVD